MIRKTNRGKFWECPVCGEWYRIDEDAIECGVCNGLGFLPSTSKRNYWIKCEVCEGNGWVVEVAGVGDDDPGELIDPNPPTGGDT